MTWFFDNEAAAIAFFYAYKATGIGYDVRLVTYGTNEGKYRLYIFENE